MHQPTWDVKATLKSRMTAETTDSDSWTQKLIQPYLWTARVARDMAGHTGTILR